MSTAVSDYPQRDVDLWSRVFGSAPGSWPWVWDIDFIEGDWDKPGRAKVVYWNPDGEWDAENQCPAEIEGEAELTMDSIRDALEECVSGDYRDACTGRPIHERMDWDACSSDTLLQLAVMGTVTFG